MKCVDPNYKDRVYLPSQNNGVDIKEYLNQYINREFPEPTAGNNVVYSVPSKFSKSGEKQGSFAEETVFQRLRDLADCSDIKDLWVIFFYSATYAGHSSRNQRVGKLMIREHDFVVFVKFGEKYFMVLTEVKSTYDGSKRLENVDVVSDAKAIKNNKRSAQHQLRDHMEILQKILEIDTNENKIQCYIMWPFLSDVTRDPKQNVIKRWNEDSNLHLFEKDLRNQNDFNKWFQNNVLKGNGIGENEFYTLLNRYVILSCGIFVDEINQGMLAFLTQEQLELISSDLCTKPGRGPMVVHGAAGTGKSLLVLKKLEQLHQLGLLNDDNLALYICYWPGIRLEMQEKLKFLGIEKYVDTARFYIFESKLLIRTKRKYKHIFMDESEAVCLAVDPSVMARTLSTVCQYYHEGNCSIPNCIKNSSPSYHLSQCQSVINQTSDMWGELWFLVDINQASIFVPQHSPPILKHSNIILNKVMRTTGYIFNIFKQYYVNPIPGVPQSAEAIKRFSKISIGHHIMGPPIFWASSDEYPSKQSSTQYTAVKVIIDLCATKGFKPNDICILPFFINDNYVPETMNREIDQYFVENGFRPRCVGDVVKFISNKEVNDFLIAWALSVKGLEFKVVVLVIEEDDFDAEDSIDRKKTYIMASRCTCMLILVCPRSVKDIIDVLNITQNYPFNIEI